MRKLKQNLFAGVYANEIQSGWSYWVASWKDVFRNRTFVSDVTAGLTVAAVALPLNVALAVVSGLPPSAGLVAGAVGGMAASLFGGAPLQVTGPAAALNVMVLAVATQHGAVGVAACAVIVGVVELALALLGAGRFTHHVPESVLAGFTTGVGLKILDAQIPELLGFDYKVIELAQMMHQPAWLHHVSWLSVICGMGVAFLVSTTRQYTRFPAAIIGIGVVTFVAVYLKWDITRVGDVPSHFASPSFPLVPDERWLDLGVQAFPLGLLAAAESLLSAKSIDRMTANRHPHNSNVELVGQGIANIAVGCMAGMPVSGVVVRSSVNVQSGGKTRLSAFIHGALLTIAVLYLSHTISHVPLSALAGLLCIIGYRLIDVTTFRHLLATEKLEVAAFVVTMAGTVTGHLMLSLVGGLAIHQVNRFLLRNERGERAGLERNIDRGIRAVLPHAQAEARTAAHIEPTSEYRGWVSHIRDRQVVPGTAHVHRQANVVGRVVLGDHVHIAAGTSVRADEGSPFFIGRNSNIQDGVVIHALKDRRVMVGDEAWAVYVGKNVSIAHNALVHGPCFIGDDTFVGFKAVVHDAVVGAGCYIGIGAVVVGVEVPPGKFVPHGRIVDTADAVDALPPVSHAHEEFNKDVVDVNRGLARAYNVAAEGADAGIVNAVVEQDKNAIPERPAWGVDWASAGRNKDVF